MPQRVSDVFDLGQVSVIRYQVSASAALELSDCIKRYNMRLALRMAVDVERDLVRRLPDLQLLKMPHNSFVLSARLFSPVWLWLIPDT